MPRKASPWAIYEKEMTACDLGIPLWEPNPPYVDDTPRYERIEPGDVGVLQSGSFELLFNVFLDSDHERQRYFGVPSDFKPLRLPGPQDRTGERVVATAAPLRGGSAAPAVPFDVGAKFDFELSKESGAVLLFNKPARRYEMGQSDHLEQHIRVNYKSWMRFAREQGYSVYQSRLYVVTGVIRTSQWAMATWNSSSKSFGAKASLSISGVGDASVAYRGHWSSSNKTVITNQGPAIDTLGGTDNQTLFFSTLAIRARRLFPAKIRAAAGPHVLGSGDRDVSSAPGVLGQNNEDEDVEILRIPGSAKDSDVLAPLLDYILDSCPDAEAALARDSDLMPYLLGRYDDVAIKKNLKLFAPDITVTDGDHLINVEREPQNIQELLAIVQIIAILPKLLPGNKLSHDLSGDLPINEYLSRLVARQVGEWCSELAFFARQYPNANPEAIAEANRVARNIVTEMHVQSPPGGQVRIIAIIRRSEMEERLSYCLRQIQEICRRFQVTSSTFVRAVNLSRTNWFNQLRTHSRIEDFDMAVQVNAFQELNYQDHIATMEELSDTSGFNALVAELDGERDAKRLSAIHLGLAQVMQNGLEVYSAGDAKRVSLAVNLYEVLRRSQELLPDLELCHGEVERVGTSPVSGGPKYDEWEGRYLSSEQVRIKVFRTYLPTASGDVASPDKYQRRFQRESEIWYETWKKDRGKYLVPFYGYSVTDTGGPYMVSPYYPRTADVYVKQASGIDHLALLHDIAKGVEVLHTMDPPVIHGCIKGSNVFIASDGTVRLGNFGFSKLMEDVMGEPYTATGTSQEEVRWRPPERWQGQGILSIEGDIWELGMTMLELLSHEKPWKEFRHAGPVLAAVQSGSRPARPGDPEVLERGLTDELWMVMQACWATERQDRPKIGEVLAVVSGRRGVAMT
ncbi:hypothetical protein OE88DRAFT_1740984 [Heliocybe sulcata]|uniref:Protein kinase domain-containing protein n=1 Tax=Heliocybe sulcata TaxID=5364 RepID=A0A5C3NG91_9AGAM|nr:hypothetical protein OE88DRAFT_1740984 [Heliocybe sulcata]